MVISPDEILIPVHGWIKGVTCKIAQNNMFTGKQTSYIPARL